MSKATIAVVAKAIMDCEDIGPIKPSDAATITRVVLRALRVPTPEMQAAAYYAGSVGDGGGAEREDFATEWTAAIDQALSERKPTGLLALVRPYSDD